MIDWLYYGCVNIFKTFEILLAEPLSIIRKRIIHILHVETNIFANDRVPLEFQSNDHTTQITVYNNKKMYDILSTVIHKKKMKAQARQPVNKLDMLWENRALPSSIDEDEAVEV